MAYEIGLGHTTHSFLLDSERKFPLIAEYYMSHIFVQAFSPLFMRVFCISLWKSGFSSGDSGFHLLRTTPCQLFTPVKAKDRVSLPQNALPPQRTKSITRIEVFIVLCDD